MKIYLLTTLSSSNRLITKYRETNAFINYWKMFRRYLQL